MFCALQNKLIKRCGRQTSEELYFQEFSFYEAIEKKIYTLLGERRDLEFYTPV